MQEERHNLILIFFLHIPPYIATKEFLKLEHNNNNLRALSCLHESVDITGACCEQKNYCNDNNIDSLPKSAASFERAMHVL